MPEIKNFDVAALEKRVEEAAERGRDGIEDVAKRAIAAIHDVAAARAALPERFLDLVQTAQIVDVRMIEVVRGYMRDDAGEYQGFTVEILGEAVGGQISERVREPLPRGRYRALLFLMRID